MNNTLSMKALDTVFIHSLMFCAPFLVLITNSGTGLASLVFVLAALYYWSAERAALRPHWPLVRGVVLAFGASMALAVAAYLLDPEVRLRDLEKPIRMMAAVSGMLVVLALRPSRKALWWGMIGGAVCGAVFIVYQRWGLGVERPGGLMNSITFGDISLCLGMMCLAATLDFKGRQAVWPSIGVLAGLVGSIATGTRGGWVAIVLSVLLLVKCSHFLRGRLRKAIALLGLAMVVSTYFIPQTGTRERIHEGINDVSAYLQGGNTNTNVGTRLELWRGGARLVAQHPWFGSSVPQVKRELRVLVASGELPGFVLNYDHFHNDALQALVFGGVAGLLAWAGTLLAPFLFFLRRLGEGQRGRPALVAPALAGLLLVLCYFSFGLTEVIFWTGHSAVFYALMLFMLAGLCLNAEQPAASAPREGAAAEAQARREALV